jgi:hypothetical protein
VRTYDPEWRIKTYKPGAIAHLIERDSTRGGYTGPTQKTLCGTTWSDQDGLLGFDRTSCKRCSAVRDSMRPSLVGRANVVKLRESSYEGMVAGAFHWTGGLKLGNLHAVDLEFELTFIQARRMNDLEVTDVYSKGLRSSRFFSRENLRGHAVEQYRILFPEARALFALDHCGRGPAEILDFPSNPEAIVSFNDVYSRWERGEEGVESEWDLLCRRYNLHTESYR